ncbi:MAG: SufD family Fe-S cluster assembly protein, partial [Thermoplasmata archaeon]
PLDRLTALAIATWNRGYDLTIPPRCSAPIRVQDLTILSQPHEALSVRRTIDVGAESQAIFSEEMYTTPTTPAGQRLAASFVDIDIGANCQVAYLGVHAPDLSTISLYQRHATVGPAAKVGWVWTGFGGFRTKTRNATDLVGQGANADDLQAFFGSGPQAYDSSVNLTHVGTDTHGQSITRGVFRDDSRGMSRGLVRIEKDARKTVSYISEHAMLLSRGARSDTIPILEILCRDVKATHSSSVAPVDPEKVFYLESRGLSHDEAVRLIGEGFLSHVMDRSPIAHLREILYPMLEARWENRSIDWGGSRLPALPVLTASEAALAGDWRFDAKLR